MAIAQRKHRPHNGRRAPLVTARNFGVRLDHRSPHSDGSATVREDNGDLEFQGHFTTGGMELRMLSTFPPVFKPNVVPRS